MEVVSLKLLSRVSFGLSTVLVKSGTSRPPIESQIVDILQRLDNFVQVPVSMGYCQETDNGSKQNREDRFEPLEATSEQLWPTEDAFHCAYAEKVRRVTTDSALRYAFSVKMGRLGFCPHLVAMYHIFWASLYGSEVSDACRLGGACIECGSSRDMDARLTIELGDRFVLPISSGESMG